MDSTKRFWNDFKAFAFSDNLFKVAIAFVLVALVALV